MVDLPKRQSKPRTPVVKVYPTQDDAAKRLGQYPLRVREEILYITVEGKDIEVMPIGAGLHKRSYMLRRHEDVHEFKLRT